MKLFHKINHNDIYVTSTKSSHFIHNAKSHLYSKTNFGLNHSDIEKALQTLRSDSDGAPIHARTFAYEVVRHVSHSNLSAWQDISDAVMQDFSASEHLDHTIAALHTFESLPTQILLTIATDPDVGGRMTSILEHQSSDIRRTAIRCLSSAWLRVWYSLAAGELRLAPFDEENEDNESVVRQHTCDRVVAIWKAIVALCTSDDDDAVAAAAFRAMEMLFDAGCLSEGSSSPRPEQEQQGSSSPPSSSPSSPSSSSPPSPPSPPQPVALELTLRVFKAMGGRVYSLAARMRSLSGHHLAQAILGMTAFYVLAISSGSTVRVEGSAKDVDPTDLAETFAQTALLPMLGAINTEVQLAAAMSTQRLARLMGSIVLQNKWLVSVAKNILPTMSVARFGALNSVRNILLECLPFTLARNGNSNKSSSESSGIHLSVQIYITLCSADVSNIESRASERLQILQKTNEIMMISTLRKNNYKPFNECMMDQILQHNWMRQIIQGTVNAPSHVRHQILYFFITEIRKRMNKIISTTTSISSSQFNNIQHVAVQVLKACAPCLCWWDEGDETELELGKHDRNKDAAQAYLGLLADICVGVSKMNETKEKEKEEEEEEEEDAQEDDNVQELLDELFEWHLPNIRRASVRISLVRLLCACWSCDGDPGDADLMVSIVNDIMYSHRKRYGSDALPSSSLSSLSSATTPMERGASLPLRRLITGDSIISSSSGGRMTTGDSINGETTRWMTIADGEKNERKKKEKKMTTLIEHARVLLPSIALFAARNPVAKEAVLGLLNNTKTVRNDVVRTLARQSKEWIRTMIQNTNKTTLLSKAIPIFDEKNEIQNNNSLDSDEGKHTTTVQVFQYRTLTGTADPLRIDAQHTATTVTTTVGGKKRKRNISSSFTIRVRLYNLTNVAMNNVRIRLNTTGCIGIGKGTNGTNGTNGTTSTALESPSGHLFPGELVSGGMVEWESSSFVVSRFCPFAFHIVTAIPNVLFNNRQEWPLFPGEEDEKEVEEMENKKLPLIFECSPYDVEFQDLFSPIQLDTYNAVWTQSIKNRFILDGILLSQGDQEVDTYLLSLSKKYFAMQSPQNNGKNDNNDSNDNNDNNGNNDTNRSAFRSIKYATQSISDGSILMMNVETVRNGRIRTTTGLNTKRTLSTSIRFEFRSSNIEVIQQLEMHMEQNVWLRTSVEDISLQFVNSHSNTARKDMRVDKVDRIKMLLGSP